MLDFLHRSLPYPPPPWRLDCSQVVVGGRSKYFINGTAAQASRVQTLFHSVQLNVNNPHFLIMQGRITKVLNMKPVEVLGMLEEAAGTRMYEDKKRSAERVIDKKEGKVREINEVLAKEINPTLARLRDEQREYRRHQQNREELEKLARLIAAHQWVVATEAFERSIEDLDTLKDQAAQARADATRLRAEADAREARVAELEEARRAAMGPEYRRVADLEAERGKALVEAQARLASAKDTLKREERSAQAAAAAAAEAEAAAEAIAARLAKRQEEDAAVCARASAAKAEYEAAEAAYEAACTGVAAAGAKAGEGGGTVQGRMMQAREAAASAAVKADTAGMRAKHLRDEAAACVSGLGASKAAFDRLHADKASADAAAREAEAAVERLAGSHDAREEKSLLARRDERARAVDKLAAAADKEAASLGSRLRFDYDESSMGARWDPAAVKGVVARLVRVKDPSAATALEVAAGGRLWQVVVQSADAGKALLKKGRLQRRVTLIPLDRVSGSSIPADRAARASEISRGKAVPALSLVGYSEEVEAAMQHVFGRALVCEDKAAAQACAFDRAVRCVSVTKEGDVYDPAGTLEGGSRASGGGILLRLGKLADIQERLDAARVELAAIEKRLTELQAAGAALEEARAERDICLHRMRLAEGRLESCEYAEAKGRADKASEEAAALEAEATAQRAEVERATALLAKLEGDSGDEEGRREREEADAEKRLAVAKKAAVKAEKAMAGAAQRAEELGLELERAKTDAEDAANAATVAEATAGESRGKCEDAEQRVREDAEAHAEADDALGEHRRRVAETDELLAGVLRERDEARAGADEAEATAVRSEAEARAVDEARRKGKRQAAHLERAHPWIEEERAQFGKAGTLYDFQATTPEAARERVAALQEDQERLKRKINLDAGAMLERAEREYRGLVDKKDRIEADKRKIQRVIGELDAKKVEALDTTWRRVNRDFASIFSTLLPGTSACLAPLDGPAAGTAGASVAAAAAGSDNDSDEDDEAASPAAAVAAAAAAAAAAGSASGSSAAQDLSSGLEIRVSFNGVWKESLTELSGGQRSLLALSLILAMLLFKPAPVYILDEVDAALDLSHTQNIGRMLRTHFRGSQFLVVSLKQGMFSNANVIFRTKFVDGVSTVTRTIGRKEAAPASAAESQGAKSAAAAAAGAAASAVTAI